MVVTRLHSKLFEAAALDLDRRTRFHFVGQNVRPGYIEKIERQLQDVAKPDFTGELNFMVAVVESGPDLKGRFLWFKTLLKRALHPFSGHTGYVHRMIIQRLLEQHEAVTRLAESVVEENDKLRDDFVRLVQTVRDELAEAARPSPSVDPVAPSWPGDATVATGSKLILGPVAVKRRGYVHFDPTAEDSAPLDRLPVAPGTMAEVVAANVLEHYTVDEVREVYLPYWASLLQPGGRLSVIADDLGAAGDRFRDGQIDFSEMAAVLFGDGRRPRKSAYTPEMLWQYVEETGLSDLSVTGRKQRPETGAYGFELTAFRSAS